MTRNIPDDAHRFLLAHIDSVEQLEILLLLCRTDGTAWTAAGVAQALHSQPSSVARRLDGLCKKGIVVAADGTYRYGPGDSDIRAAIARLAAAYRERPVAVITIIASKPMENVQAFSDAFRLRNKPPADD